jgi:hypothetical protein
MYDDLDNILPHCQPRANNAGDPDIDFRAYLKQWSLKVRSVMVASNRATSDAQGYIRAVFTKGPHAGRMLGLRIFDDASYSTALETLAADVGLHLQITRNQHAH